MTDQTSILIVDDNVGLRKTTSLILARKGYAVATAADGPQAIERVQNKPFDLIFLDIKMAPMDGVETYRRIKKIRPAAVVIMMTAYAVEDLIQEALQQGAYGVIYKPLDIEKVVALVKQAQETRRGALVLVVDDDASTCTIFKNVLRKRGYQVGIAQTGEQAIALARERAYDVIFIDVQLPTLNGLETYLAIKEIHPEAVAVMMTAYCQETADLVEQALHNSAYTCFYKPLDMTKVIGLVDEICEKKR